MARRPRLSDVAVRLGLSTSTVSLALNDHPRIPAQTKKDVRRVAEEIGYVTNRFAADLRRGTSSIIGLCINDLANPVFVEFTRHIEAELKDRQLQLLLCNASESVEKQDKFLRTLQEYGAAGALICPAMGTDGSAVKAAVPAHFPIVTFSRLLSGADVSGIANEDAKGVEMAIEHLVDQGHRRIAWIGGGGNSSTSQQRRQGYSEGLEKVSLPVDETIILTGPTTRETGYRLTTALLQNPHPPSAIVAFGDLLALGAYAAVAEAGLRVGPDIALVGFDDIEECKFASPPLSSISVNKAEIARQAVECLANEIRDPGIQTLQKRLAPELKVRASSSPQR